MSMLGKHLIGHLTYRLFVGCLLLFIAALGLEIYARLAFRYELNHNPRILRHIQNFPPPPPSISDAIGKPPAEAGCPNPADKRPEVAAPRAKELLDMRLHQSIDAPLSEQFFVLFAAIPNEERDIIARAFSVNALALNPEGYIVQEYGSYGVRFLVRSLSHLTKQQMQELTQHAAQSVQTGKAVDAGNFGAGCKLYVRPGSSEILVVEPLQRPIAESVSPDSPWDIPYFKYKKSWRGNNPPPGTLTKTNNAGFRGDDIVLPKPAGTFRIICVGGSTTEEGVTDKNTYPFYLQQSLNPWQKQFQNRIPVSQIEVINCGIPGIDSSGQLLRMEDYLRLEPDLVLLYEGVNDLVHQLKTLWQDENASRAQKLLFHSALIHKFLPGVLGPSHGAMEADIARYVLGNIRAIAAVFERASIPVIICGIAHPAWHSLYFEERTYFNFNIHTYWAGYKMDVRVYFNAVDILNQDLKEWCMGAGICFVPMQEWFDDSGQYFGDICHMFDVGIRKKSNILTVFVVNEINHILQNQGKMDVRNR